MKKAKLTLIEVLVVVAFSAVLTAAVMPAISNNRRKAASLTCQANLKQIGFAAMMYSCDFDSYIPRAGSRYDKSLVELFLPYLGYDKEIQIDNNGLPVGSESMDDVKAFKCPAYPDKEAFLGYVHNGWNLPHTNTNGASDYPTTSKEQIGPTKLNQFIRLSETIYMADNEYFTPSSTTRYPVRVLGPDPESGLPEYRWCNVFRPSHLPCATDQEQPSISEMSRSYGRRMARNRHDNGSNALYADWHAGRVKTSDMLKPGYSGYQTPLGNAAGVDMWRFWK